MHAALAFLLACQQDQTALRVEKQYYLPAIAQCKEGEGLIDSDPREAIARFDAIIASTNLQRRIESRLRVEEKVSEYTDWYFFLPYQYRGRARLKLASKSERDAALKLVAAAVEDFQESVRKGVAGATLQKGVLSSEDLLKSAKAELERLKTAGPAVKPPDPPKDPEPEFRSAFLDLLSQRRFREAREQVETAGGFLTEAKRKEYLQRADGDCRRYLGDLLDRYAGNLASATAASIGRMSAQDFEAGFPLPKETEVCVKLEALDWAAAFRPVLERLRLREDTLDGLLQGAASAAPLEEKDRRAWFRGSAGLAYQVLEPRVRLCVQKSRSAGAEERARLHSEALALKQRWSALADGLSKEFRERMAFLGEHLQALDALIGQFPISPDAIAKAGPDLEKSFEVDRPEPELERIERGLAKIHADQGDRLAVESRQQLLSYLLVAASLRHLLAGKDTEAVAALPELRKVGLELKDAGGPIDVKRFGAKVARVVDALAR
jgi:hypothetical protein